MLRVQKYFTVSKIKKLLIEVNLKFFLKEIKGDALTVFHLDYSRPEQLSGRRISYEHKNKIFAPLAYKGVL